MSFPLSNRLASGAENPASNKAKARAFRNLGFSEYRLAVAIMSSLEGGFSDFISLRIPYEFHNCFLVVLPKDYPSIMSNEMCNGQCNNIPNRFISRLFRVISIV